jgi:hypothetical protein
MEIHHHIHLYHHGLEKLESQIRIIKQKQNKIMGALEDIKSQLAVSDEKIDILTTATAGVSQDVAFIKAKLEAAGTGGIDAAGVEELKGLVAAQSEKLTTAAQALADLDASTDSNEA